MPKQKSHSGAKKRFTFTATGKVKRSKNNSRHILTKKSSKRKRGLRKAAYVSETQADMVRKILPYS